VDAYERGHLNVTGDPGVIKLVGNVVLRHMARGQSVR
jgi:hypothetical protein